MSIIGHSMGGHGALCTYLASKAKQYRSASAFAPISNPINAPWGKKAFEGYLQGGVQEAKEQYDATELISKHSDPVHILIDYVRHNLPLIPLKIDIKNMKTHRERTILSTKPANFFQRISSTLHARRVTTKSKYVSESKWATIIATTS